MKNFNENVCILIWISLQHLFPNTQLTMCQHCFRQWLYCELVTSHYLNQWWLSLLLAFLCITQPQEVNSCTTLIIPNLYISNWVLGLISTLLERTQQRAIRNWNELLILTFNACLWEMSDQYNRTSVSLDWALFRLARFFFFFFFPTLSWCYIFFMPFYNKLEFDK